MESTMTEEQRKKALIVKLIPIVESVYDGEMMKTMKEGYALMYEALNDTPVEERLAMIESYTFEVAPPASIPKDENTTGRMALILLKLFTTIFTMTYKDLKGDLLEALKSVV